MTDENFNLSNEPTKKRAQKITWLTQYEELGDFFKGNADAKYADAVAGIGLDRSKGPSLQGHVERFYGNKEAFLVKIGAIDDPSKKISEEKRQRLVLDVVKKSAPELYAEAEAEAKRIADLLAD